MCLHLAGRALPGELLSPALFATALDALNDECLRVIIRPPQGLRDSVAPPISRLACLLAC